MKRLASHRTIRVKVYFSIMGVPKFARFICERYPCILELLNDYQIPEFDNLYLDMNGIIHCCSHPNDADAHFRISEETIFRNIFNYVEILFRTIKPQKLFFMAVDGVAPRAKINQQRGRRFRAAREAEQVEARARAKGDTIPEESRFDSNCITPGTLFMAKLTEQLKYFVVYKISTDKLWQKCKVILSGPEVPGEGEHKIMDYIRYLKAQPNHDPNTRHCLYGLDADLIMLSLCTHEPHFTVLREEVRYGKNIQKFITPEKTKFCLLHISLLREYMEHEFESIKYKLSFPFDVEKIIDDWILMGFLVGNDFIPHLPNLHIANGALPLLYHVYMDILPTLDGYINEAGVLNLERFEKFMERLAVIDVEYFAEHLADLKYFEGKTSQRPNENERSSNKKSRESDESPKNTPSPLLKGMRKELNALIQSTDEILLRHSDEEEQFETDSDSDLYNLEFLQHKRDYYMNKFEYENVDADVMRAQAEAYVTAIQWNLHYYYEGCCSWSWYYPHHYAPYISDIRGFKDLKFNFKLCEPFLPFQQLLAVLPSASRNLLPQAYQSLLTEQQSPIIDYYPGEFRTDLNEKKQEWEAIVLIPFIDEQKLIEAMEPFDSYLTPEEKGRNRHGPMRILYHTEKNVGTVTAPDYFPTIQSHAMVENVSPDDIRVPQNKLVKGLAANAKLHVYYSGFPTMQHIKHTAKLEKLKVKVFEQPSRGDNMILTILPTHIPSIEQVAIDILGQIVYVRWPHLLEAHVLAISDGERKYTLIDASLNHNLGNLRREELNSSAVTQWKMEAKNIVSSHRNRLGIDVGDIKMIIHARPITGRRYILTSQGRLSLSKEWSNYSSPFAYQSIVRNIEVEDEGYIAHKNITDIYVPNSICFMLGHPHYGAMGEIIAPGVNVKNGRVKVAMKFMAEPTFESLRREQNEARMQFMCGSIVAQRLGISSHLLSRITGSIFVTRGTNDQSERKQQNIGLNLKFNKKNEELPGYTRKVNGQWLYSPKSLCLIRNYMEKFPRLFQRLAQNVGNDIYNEDELSPGDPQGIANVSKWIKGQPFCSIEVRNCDWEGLDPDIIQKLSIEIDEYLKKEAEITKTVLMQVKPHLLYKPGLNAGNITPDSEAKHKVFDRIITVKENSYIPLGYRGTIISIQCCGDDPNSNSYQILFDKSFVENISFTVGATTRRFTLLAAEFINISHGIRAEQNILDISTCSEKYNHEGNTIALSESESGIKSSAFASFKKYRNPLPKFCENQHDSEQFRRQIRSAKKNIELDDHSDFFVDDNSEKKTRPNDVDTLPTLPSSEVQPTTVTPTTTLPSSTRSNAPQSTRPDRATEFQLLWNELHRLPVVPGGPHKPMGFSAMLPVSKPSITSATESLQDPSAFLKAVLKIPDDKSMKNPFHSSGTTEAKSVVFRQSSPAPPSSTPTLVQQLFDHARQAHKMENISYCSLLLHHFQLLGIGMPRYFYSTDDQNLIRAQIVLPDMRNYQGESCANHELAAESAASIAYRELNLNQSSPMRPQLDPPSRDTWINIALPNIPQNAHTILSSFPDAQKSTARPSASWNPLQNPRMPELSPRFSQIATGRIQQIRSRAIPGESKLGEKLQNVTPFVPLQAQKKTRPHKTKDTQYLSESDASKVSESKLPKAQKTKPTTLKDFPKFMKTDKLTKINDVGTLIKENPNEQKTVKIQRQRKSRIAANFGVSPVDNVDNDNVT